jgi:anaerobic magnesium-protoporphyrin IX monomethyl ester cyclase
MRYAVIVAESFALGPAYLITFLRSQGHDVKLFFDPVFGSVGGTQHSWFSKLLCVEDYNIRQITKYKPDFCLFSITTAHYQWALRMARRIKENVETKVIMGGVHPTSVPDVVKSSHFVDDVCTGDGISYFKGVFNPDIIMPERNDFYRELPPKDISNPYIMTSFGCPFSCTYCLPRHLKLKKSRRSVDGCIAELKWLKEHGAKRISIWDDVFTTDKKWLFEFLSKYIDEIKLPFRCVTHCKLVDEEIIYALKAAGCHTIAIGIQTGSEWLRKDILNRRETNMDFLKACALIKKHDIILLIDHIFGIPFETEQTFKDSYDLYRMAKPDMVNVFELVYFPKAEIIQHAIRAGLLKESDIPRIERGELPQYASGVNNIIANSSPWVRRLLCVPIGKQYEWLPEWMIRVILYTRMFVKTWADCIPITIMENYVHYTIKRIQKW